MSRAISLREMTVHNDSQKTGCVFYVNMHLSDLHLQTFNQTLTICHTCKPVDDIVVLCYMSHHDPCGTICFSWLVSLTEPVKVFLNDNYVEHLPTKKRSDPLMALSSFLNTFTSMQSNVPNTTWTRACIFKIISTSIFFCIFKTCF